MIRITRLGTAIQYTVLAGAVPTLVGCAATQTALEQGLVKTLSGIF
jgi:hypothetical protein